MKRNDSFHETLADTFFLFPLIALIHNEMTVITCFLNLIVFNFSRCLFARHSLCFGEYIAVNNLLI